MLIPKTQFCRNRKIRIYRYLNAVHFPRKRSSNLRGVFSLQITYKMNFIRVNNLKSKFFKRYCIFFKYIIRFYCSACIIFYCKNRELFFHVSQLHRECLRMMMSRDLKKKIRNFFRSETCV